MARVLSWLGMALCVGLTASLVMSLDNYKVRTRQFQVRDFEVVGNHRLSADQVISAAGATVGNDLFKIELSKVRERLEAMPWVRQARARKQLPGRLVLEVEEYVPVVLVAGGEMMLADDTCHLIAPPERGAHYKLPVVTGISIEDLRRDPPNAATLLAQRRLRRAIEMIGAWPHSERFALGEVNWDPVRGITLLSADDGAEIRLGHAKDDALQRRFEQIDALLGDLERRGEQLRYALMDDEGRPGRAVVQTVTAAQAAARPQQNSTTKAAGPRTAKVPQGDTIRRRRAKAKKTNKNEQSKRADVEVQPRNAGGR